MKDAHLTDEVASRARRRRARLTSRSKNLSGIDGPVGDRVEEIGAGTDIVLMVAALPPTDDEAVGLLSDLRDRLDASAQLWIVDRAAVPAARDVGRTPGRLKLRRRPQVVRDTVVAIRQAGWTVTSIERFGGGIVQPTGETAEPEIDEETWVDLVAQII